MAIDVQRIGARSPHATLVTPRTRRVEDGSSRARQLLSGRIPSFWGRKVSIEELAMFTQQLALLLQTGNSLAPSVKALASQSGSPAMRDALEDVHDRLEQGAGFSESLGAHPEIFDTLFVSLVRAGEATGALQESFRRLNGILEIRRRLRSRITEAMTYPLVLSVLMVVVVIFIMIYIVPRFSEVFDGLGDQLPVTTRFFLQTAAFLRSRWWLLVPMMIGGALVAPRVWRLGFVRRAWDWLRMRTPFVGGLYMKSCLFQLCSTLGLLMESRVPLMEAIGIVRKVIPNGRFERLFSEVAKNVEAGRGIARAFQEASFLPSSVKLMVTTGETSGSLDMVMTKLADRYREDLESDIRRLGTLLEPLMLVVMGVMVGFIAIAFILPIFRMSRAIH
jgi:type II secretory pathway component PulF